MKKSRILSVLMLSMLVLGACNLTNQTSSSATTSNTSNNTTNNTTSSVNPTSNTSSSNGTTTTTTKLYAATLETNAPTYYDSLTGLKGVELKDALHELIDGHETFSYSSQINGFMRIYDIDLENKDNMMFAYTGSAKNTTSFDKEHVWAKSHGGFDNSTGTGSDLHNLRPCIPGLNSSRGNKYFAEGGTEYSAYKGNYSTSSTFEPSDAFKGDVARTIFYMATRYEKDNEFSGIANVDLEVNSPSSSRYYDFSSGADGVHGNFDDLYKWAVSGIDPVDNYEVNRNNIIYKDYQHNRNPFVDHPEFIIMIYDKNYNGPGALIDLDGQGTTESDLVSKTIELINNLGEVTLDSEEALLEAERYYEQLDETKKKEIPAEVYQKLLDARKDYDELVSNYEIEVVIDLISKIPSEITLQCKDAITTALDYYNLLTETQKQAVTNYEKLKTAKEKLDEIISEMGDVVTLYEANFLEASTQQSYTAGTVTLSSNSLYFNRYYNSGEFRLGHNKTNSVDSKFLSALSLSSVDGSSMEMKFDVTNSYKVTLNTVGLSYGTVKKIYILKSTDQGNTYSLCAEFDYSNSVYSYEYEGDVEESCRYAVVITGTKPRIVLESFEIIGLE